MSFDSLTAAPYIPWAEFSSYIQSYGEENKEKSDTRLQNKGMDSLENSLMDESFQQDLLHTL